MLDQRPESYALVPLSQRHFSRRAVVTSLAAMTGLVATGCGSISSLHSPASDSTHSADTANPINIIWQCQNNSGGEYKSLVDNYNKTNRDGIHVALRNLPLGGDMLSLYENTLHNGDIDVMSVDIVHSAYFASKGWMVPLNDKWLEGERALYLSGPFQSCTYNNKIVAVPLQTDVGLIFYRTDILKTPPNTWSDLVNLLQKNASKARYGYIWQGLQNEALTCDFIEVLHGYGGDVLAANDPKSVIINSPAGIQALTEMVNWIGTISPPSVTQFDEWAGLLAFAKGDAIVMRNWPYAYAALSDPTFSKIAGKFDVHPLFFGGSQTIGRSCVGGWNLAINAFSKRTDASWKFIQYMLGPYAQKQLALQDSFTPTLRSVYSDPEVLQRVPLFTQILPILQTALPRPVSSVYPELSKTIQTHVHRALLKLVSPEAALSALQNDLQALVSR